MDTAAFNKLWVGCGCEGGEGGGLELGTESKKYSLVGHISLTPAHFLLESKKLNIVHRPIHNHHNHTPPVDLGIVFIAGAFSHVGCQLSKLQLNLADCRLAPSGSPTWRRKPANAIRVC